MTETIHLWASKRKKIPLQVTSEHWEIVLDNTPFIYYIIDKHFNHWIEPHGVLDKEDLFQEGMFGVLMAIHKYDPERGTGHLANVMKFYIRNAINEYLRQSRIVIPTTPDWVNRTYTPVTQFGVDDEGNEVETWDHNSEYQPPKRNLSQFIHVMAREQVKDRRRAYVLARQMLGQMTLKQAGEQLDLTRQRAVQLRQEIIAHAQTVVKESNLNRTDFEESYGNGRREYHPYYQRARYRRTTRKYAKYFSNPREFSLDTTHEKP